MAKGETYEEFTAKFEPKRTTDDCYTPPEVFDAVLSWACREYGIDFAVEARECEFIRALDMQREMGKGIYGSGYLIGGDALARRADADRLAAMRGGGCETSDGVVSLRKGAGRRITPWAEHVTFELSKRERGIVGRLG